MQFQYQPQLYNIHNQSFNDTVTLIQLIVTVKNTILLL